MLQIKNEIEEMKRIKKVCHADLRTARALFSTNPDLESLEEDFRKLINHIDVVERYCVSNSAYFLSNTLTKTKIDNLTNVLLYKFTIKLAL